MALAALYRFLRRVLQLLPNNMVAIDFCTENIFACIEVMTTYQIQVEAYCAESGALARCWLPQAFGRNSNLKSKALSLLDSFDKML